MSHINLLDTYTSRRACEVLGVTRFGLHSLAVRGIIRQVRFPDERYPRYVRVDVDARVAQRQVKEAVLQDGLYTAKEARQHLGNMPAMTFYGQVKAGTIRSVMLPGGYTKGYVVADVEALALTYHNLFDRPVAHPDEDAYQALYACMAAARITEDGSVLPSRQACYLAWLFGIAVQDAEDVIQRTFIDLWEHGAAFFATFEHMGQRIVVMHARLKWAMINELDERAKRARLVHEVQGWSVSWCKPRVPTVEEQVVMRERITEVMQYCRHLPQEQRLIAEFAMAGYTVEEIGAYLRQEGIITTSNRTVTRQRATVMDQLRENMASVLEAVS